MAQAEIWRLLRLSINNETRAISPGLGRWHDGQRRAVVRRVLFFRVAMLITISNLPNKVYGALPDLNGSSGSLAIIAITNQQRDWDCFPRPGLMARRTASCSCSQGPVFCVAVIVVPM